MVRIFMQQVSAWDTRVFHWVFGEGDRKALRRSFFFLSRSADGSSCLFIGLMALIAVPATGKPFLLAAFPAFALELALYYTLKKGVRRPRPFRSLAGIRFFIQPPDEFSFPSGHTAAAFVMASLLGAACPALLIPALAWALLVGFSRVLLGVHYPSDVLAGMALGLFSAQMGLAAVHALL